MIKFLLLGLIIYGYYKFFLAPKRLANRRNEQIDQVEDDGDYIDYEEID